MTNKNVTMVDKSELESARAENGIKQNQHQAPATKQKSNHLKTFVEKLKDKEIAEFFKPLGFVQLARSYDNSCVIVACKNFTVAISDFDVMLDINENADLSNDAFFKYCASIESTPEKVISDLVQINLLGQRFHSYGSNLNNRKQTERKQAYGALPKDMQKLLKDINGKREEEIDSVDRKLKFGDFTPFNSTNELK